VIYHADEDVKDQIELFSVRPTGGIATKLNGPMAPGGSVQVSNATSAGRVVYVADQTTNNVLELFSVPSTGGTALTLNPTLVTGGNVTSTNLGPQVSPDGSRVLYHADQSTDEVFELFSVPSTGGTPVKLNGALVAGGDVVNFGYRFSPDGSRVIYAADQVTDNVVDLFSVPAAGGTSVKLNTSGGTVAADGNISTPDGSRVVYLSHGTISEVFIVPITGGTSLKLNGPLVSGGNVTSRPVMNGNGSRIVYPADQITNGVIELFSVSTAGGTPV